MKKILSLFLGLLFFHSTALVSPLFCGVNFNGDADTVYSTAINPTDLTISCWLKKNRDGATDRVLYEYDPTAQYYVWGVQYLSSNLFEFSIWDGNSDNYARSTSTVTGTAWHHLAITYDGSNGATAEATVYLDGAIDTASATLANGSVTPSADATNTYLAALRYNNVVYYGTVQMSDVAIWDAVLTDNEIAQIGKSKIKGMPLQIQPANLQLYLPLDDLPEGTGINAATFVDRSGNGNNGTGVDADADSLAVAEQILSYP